MPILEARGLVKRFGKIVAVDNLDITIGRGDIIGLIGPNGAGKTTTIRLCLGILRRDRGIVKLFGYDPFYEPKSRERVGVIFENPSFPETTTVGKFLSHTARIYGVGIERVREVLKVTGLVEKQSSPIKTLSAGQKQRLAFAHALIHEPELIIADEPTSNLDPLGRSEVLDLLSNLNKDYGITILISSHVLPELSRIINRIALINRGKIVFQGGPSEIENMLKEKIVRIRVNDIDRMIKLLSQYFDRVEVRGASVIVYTDNPGEVYRIVGEIMIRHRVMVYGVESLEIQLEELLRKITRS